MVLPNVPQVEVAETGVYHSLGEQFPGAKYILKR